LFSTTTSLAASSARVFRQRSGETIFGEAVLYFEGFAGKAFVK
jgi:hypothetical protein